jgi:hypothetical protein
MRKEEEEVEVKEQQGEEDEADRFLPARETMARVGKYKRPVGQKLSRHPPEPPPPELINLPHIKKVPIKFSHIIKKV